MLGMAGNCVVVNYSFNVMNRRRFTIQTPPYPERYRFERGDAFGSSGLEDAQLKDFPLFLKYVSISGRTYGKLYKADFKMFTGDDVIEVKSCFETFYLCQLNFSCN